MRSFEGRVLKAAIDYTGDTPALTLTLKRGRRTVTVGATGHRAEWTYAQVDSAFRRGVTPVLTFA